MEQQDKRRPRTAGDRPAIPLAEKDRDEPEPLTPIQQAAYSAAIFGPSSSD